MAFRIKRPNVAGFFSFEARLGANEVIVVPVHRKSTNNGTNCLAFMAETGTNISYTIDHPEVIHTGIPAGQFYVSTLAGDYAATANAGSFVRIWTTPVTLGANSIVEIAKHATALQVTAPSGGCTLTIYGDY